MALITLDAFKRWFDRHKSMVTKALAALTLLFLLSLLSSFRYPLRLHLCREFWAQASSMYSFLYKHREFTRLMLLSLHNLTILFHLHHHEYVFYLSFGICSISGGNDRFLHIHTLHCLPYDAQLPYRTASPPLNLTRIKMPAAT